jgi:uncharacterized repeat protein (TIGR03803 family)
MNMSRFNQILRNCCPLDGKFYGATKAGGDSNQGTIFRLWPPETPGLSSDITVSNTLRVTVTGLSGYRYQLLRSTDLVTWSDLGTITMPASGLYPYIESEPPTPIVFYSAAWKP